MGGEYYVLWAIGILLLLGALAYGAIRYRGRRAGRAQADVERRSAPVDALVSTRTPPRDVRR